jgi:WD40 repeat protein
MYKLIFVLGFIINRAYFWCLETYNINTGQDVFQMDISPNQQYIVAGLETKIQIYNYATRAAGCSYTHGGLVRSLKFHPSSTKFALGIETDTLRIVTVTTTATCSLSKSLATGHAKVLGIDFNSDGSKMVTCGDDKTFRVWNMTPATPT